MIVGTVAGFTFPLGLGNVAALGIGRCREGPACAEATPAADCGAILTG
ncbi:MULTISPECIES: hypothetical protein [unclassified Frankia]|nr:MULTISPECIES: hypothetical protein [unclassified Frankia]